MAVTVGTARNTSAARPVMARSIGGWIECRPAPVHTAMARLKASTTAVTGSGPSTIHTNAAPPMPPAGDPAPPNTTPKGHSAQPVGWDQPAGQGSVGTPDRVRSCILQVVHDPQTNESEHKRDHQG